MPAVAPARAGPDYAPLLDPMAAPEEQAAPGTDWPQLAHDAQRTGAAPQAVAGPYRFYWRWTGVPFASRAQPVVVGSRLFVGGLEGGMYAVDASFDAQGGGPRILWRRELGSPVRAGAGVDGNVVVVGTQHGQLYGLDIATGQQLWSVATGGAIASAPLMSGGTAYVGSGDGALYAVRTSDGTLLWRRPLGAPILSAAALSAGGDRVFVVAENAVAYAIDAATGAIAWQTQLQGQGSADRWPVVLGNLVVIRTQPIHSFHDLLLRGDKALESAGPRLADWAADWNLVRPAIVQHLTSNPSDQTFFALDASTGQSRGVAPVLYTFGTNDAPAPPVVRGGALYLSHRPRHGIQTDSAAAVHVATQWDADLGRMDPASLDVVGVTSSVPFNYQFRMTSDEPSVITAAGDLVLVDNWERLGAINLATGDLIPIAQTSHSSPCYAGWTADNAQMPFYEGCPLARPVIGEGNARSGAVTAAGRIFWLAPGPAGSANGLSSIGPANGFTNPPAPPAPAPPSPGPLPPATPVPVSQLAGYVWAEPPRPVATPPADLRQRLEDEVGRMVASTDHLMPFYLERGFHGPGTWPPDATTGADDVTGVAESNGFWYDPGELVLTLSTAYPYLNPTLQTQVRAYLLAEMTRFPPLNNLPWPPDSWMTQGRAREPYAVPIRSLLGTWPPPGRPLQTLYALWAYARYTGDWAYVAAHWSEAQALFAAKAPAINQYAEIAGAIGYARMAQHLGHTADAERWRGRRRRVDAVWPELRRLAGHRQRPLSPQRQPPGREARSAGRRSSSA